ncbi:hypothetical protein [Mucilaginibacter myungsuensis]|uniref:NACHT domain-containing protein n=1 Tax=Mucilaginibacter myungsuensis TaxID=649104 RepID=A0A929KYY2_9SPHI|nr:hypothetical protein [Mucilaginibacter myungsuensis]MBE9664269.1 hypothetical protein [Mucilaginibacter myungsuensis]MDN3599973.1 hypothetical protein [Mucilaginibacter myungsuensis]
MTTFSHQTFESLKCAVLDVSGLTNIVTADCKKLEKLIFDKTKLQVSETTLKRVFGFVYCKFNPSMYTVNSMAKYCGYVGWGDFCQQQEKSAVKTTTCSADWDALKHNANKITAFTLQALKNKSGIPYPLTIKRGFINQHLDDFLETGLTATVLASPAGYGKTLALCHWVEEKLEDGSNDIVLFFSSNALMNVFLTGRDMNSWMLALLGYSNEDDLMTLSDISRRKEGNFYLVVDGIDEHMYKGDQFQMVLNQLTDIFSFYQAQSWFKMVLSMRAATWVNNRHYIELGQYDVYKGFGITTDEMSNVPMLTYHELNEICARINPNVHHQVDVEMYESFRHPLYLQFYFKQNQVNFSLNNIDHTSIYDIISGFILDKVYMGQCSAEKMMLINAFVKHMDLPARRYNVPKTEVVDMIKQYPQAYTELLSLGFIRELNTSNSFKYQANIEFVCNHFLNFSLTQYLLSANDRSFNGTMVTTLNDLFGDTALPLLKWGVYYMAKNDQLQNLQFLADADLKPNDKLDLINFTGEILKKEWIRLSKTATLSPFFNQDLSDKLFNFMFGMQYMGARYVKTLQMMLKFRLSGRKKILIYTSLAIRDIATLDMAKAEEHIHALRYIPAYEYDDMTINPLNCLNAIFNYYKHGIIDKTVLTTLTKYLFEPKNNLSTNKTAENDLLYMVALFTLKLSQNPAKGLRFSKILDKLYQPINGPVNFMSVQLSRLLIEDYMALGKFEQGLAAFEELNTKYTNQREHFTPFMAAIFKCAKIIVSFFPNEAGELKNSHNTIKMLSADQEYPNIKLYVMAFLFRYQRVLDASNVVYRQFGLDYAKIIRDNGLHNSIYEHKRIG